MHSALRVEHPSLPCGEGRGEASGEQPDIYDRFEAIGKRIALRDPSVMGAPLRWHSQLLDRWTRNFHYGRSLLPQSDYDTLRQVRILLSSDLTLLTPDPIRFKQRLRALHPHLL